MSSGIFKDYFGRGLLVDRPVATSLNIPAGTGAQYWATDTATLYELNLAGNAWVAVSGGGGGGGGPVSLDRVITAGSQTSVAFNAINQGYDNLIIRVTGRSLVGADADELRMQYNGDTGANYSWTRVGSAGGAGFSSGQNGTNAVTFGYTSGAASIANYPGFTETKMPQYSAAQFNKVGAGEFVGVGGSVIYGGVVQHTWNNVAAITDILVFYLSGAGFVNGTIVELLAE